MGLSFDLWNIWVWFGGSFLGVVILAVLASIGDWFGNLPIVVQVAWVIPCLIGGFSLIIYGPPTIKQKIRGWEILGSGSQSLSGMICHASDDSHCTWSGPQGTRMDLKELSVDIPQSIPIVVVCTLMR